jgi:tRNA G18 (ribose-2'-O)-methylase SpoU
MTDRAVTLLGDGIENPGNALAMMHAAEMFDVACCFRDTRKLAQSHEFAGSAATPLPSITDQQMRERHARMIAFDNLPGARDVYGFRAGKDFGVMVGNERRGLSHQVRALATDAVQIPMQSRSIDCLNVAAASAVALYYLCGAQSRPASGTRNPGSRRPHLLLMGAGDHIELGSAIRSATAFGWTRAFVEDRSRVWFGVDRITRSEGRAAARRARNDIRLIPCSPETDYGFQEVVVVTVKDAGTLIHKANLARGARQLIVIPDESRVEVEQEAWTRKGRDVRIARLDIPRSQFTYHYRLTATLALAEISRQLGVPAPGVRGQRGPALKYNRALEELASAQGEVVSLAELMEY